MFPHEAARTACDLIVSELAANRSVRLPIATDSMRPFLEPGDLITIRPAAISRPAPGDVLLIKSDADLLVHRLLAIRTGPGGVRLALTGGDRSPRPDAPVPLEAVVGVVAAVERNGRQLPVRAGLLGRLRAKSCLAILRATDLKRRAIRAMMPADRSERDRLLLALSLPSGAGRDDHVRPRPDMESEWNSLAAAAADEGLAETIYFHSCRDAAAADLIPAAARTRLAREYNGTLARNTVFAAQLDAIAGLLAGLDVIVLKGAWLAGRVYPSPGLRRYCDFDLLTRADSVAAADRRLRDGGYDCPKFDAADAVVSGYLNSLSYRPPAPGPAVHLHWHLLNSILPRYANVRMDINRVWERAKQAGPALELCPEHALIHLADHALRHSFDRLVLLRDMHEVVSAFDGRLDWDLLVADARRFGLDRAVWYALELASRLAGTPAPRDVLNRLMTGAPGLLERAFMRLASTGRRAPELCNLAYIGGSGSFRNAVRYLYRTMAPPKTVLAMAYGARPEQIGLGAYLRRWGRAGRQAARALFGRAR